MGFIIRIDKQCMALYDDLALDSKNHFAYISSQLLSNRMWGRRAFKGEGDNVATADEIWFSSLFEDHYALLYRIGRVFFDASCQHVELIEDQIQQTFLLAWAKRQKLTKHANPTGWLVVTFRHCMMNECRKLGRKRGRERFSFDEDDRFEMADPSAPPLESFVEDAQSKELLIKLLGKNDADLFLRYCIHGEPAKQLAQEYDMSESNVRVRISRLKKKLLLNRELFLCVVSLLVLGMNAGGS